MNPELTRLSQSIRDVPDFPKPGIIFKDITPILSDGSLFKIAIQAFLDACSGKKIDKVVGIDARGFIFAGAIAHHLGVGLIPIRKKGKLPYKTECSAYKMEYGEAVVEMHVDAVKPGEKIILIDDLLATGGTSAAAIKLIKKMGGELIEAQFLIELEFLKGRDHLHEVPIQSFLKY